MKKEISSSDARLYSTEWKNTGGHGSSDSATSLNWCVHLSLRMCCIAICDIVNLWTLLKISTHKHPTKSATLHKQIVKSSADNPKENSFKGRCPSYSCY
jgi:hypothetical protein